MNLHFWLNCFLKTVVGHIVVGHSNPQLNNVKCVTGGILAFGHFLSKIKELSYSISKTVSMKLTD